MQISERSIGIEGGGSEEKYFGKYLTFSGKSRKITVAREHDIKGNSGRK